MLIDLSHVVEEGMETYPGLPAPMICDYLSREASRERYAPGVSFQIGRIDMVGNTGTYVDAPFHRYEDGLDLAELPLDRLADLDARTVRVDPTRRAIGADAFRRLDLKGRAVLVHTGWSSRWRTPDYGRDNPHLTAEAAAHLAESGVVFVAIDSVNIDAMEDTRRPAHSILLARGIPIGEHFTNLAALPDDGFCLHAAPVKVRRVGTFPVRAYAVI